MFDDAFGSFTIPKWWNLAFFPAAGKEAGKIWGILRRISADKLVSAHGDSFRAFGVVAGSQAWHSHHCSFFGNTTRISHDRKSMLDQIVELKVAERFS